MSLLFLELGSLLLYAWDLGERKGAAETKVAVYFTLLYEAVILVK